LTTYQRTARYGLEVSHNTTQFCGF